MFVFFIPASFVHLHNYAVDLNNCKIYSPYNLVVLTL